MRVYIKCNLKPANMRGVKSHAMVLCVRRSQVISFILTPELDTNYRQHLQPVRKEGLNSSNHHQARNLERGFTSRARSMKVPSLFHSSTRRRKSLKPFSPVCNPSQSCHSMTPIVRNLTIPSRVHHARHTRSSMGRPCEPVGPSDTDKGWCLHCPDLCWCFVVVNDCIRVIRRREL
jgi:hypothetical protein